MMVFNEEYEDLIIEEFLNPAGTGNQDVRSSSDSAKSLEQSSSSGSFRSSCSCHSMQSLKHSKSSLIFHNRPILPPLLCAASRTEMAVHKRKAMDSEKRRQEKEKQRLISRVEAILAGVQISSAASDLSAISSPYQIPQENQMSDCFDSPVNENKDQSGDTVIERDENPCDKSSLTNLLQKSSGFDEMEEIMSSEEEEELFVANIVETAIRSATEHILKESCDTNNDLDMTLRNNPTDSACVEPSKFNVSAQSTSTKLDLSQGGNHELDPIIELSGSLVFESTRSPELIEITDDIMNDTKEICDPTMETGPLINCSTFAHDQSPSIDEEKSEISVEDIEKTVVRRKSFTIDEPSPYLVKSLTNDDVARKLHIPSDCETNFSSEKVRDIGPSRAELSVVNLCRILQDQHKIQMEAMRKRHQEQLDALQKELVCDEKMILPAVEGVAELRQCDVTVSPSMASTEYQDIRLAEKPADPPFSESSLLEVSRVTDVQVTPSLHEKLCKLSALCKGHLTRQLLRSTKVQEIIQVIKDTSGLILSLRMESGCSDEEISLRDSYLEERLYSQLRSALLHFHEIFFETSVGEKMFYVAQTSLLDRIVAKKSDRPQKLSAATQKSMERRRLLSSSSPQRFTKAPPKEVKSKISHIWKSEAPVKFSANPQSKDTKKLPSTHQTLPSKSTKPVVPNRARSFSGPKNSTFQNKKSSLTSHQRSGTSGFLNKRKSTSLSDQYKADRPKSSHNARKPDHSKKPLANRINEP